MPKTNAAPRNGSPSHSTDGNSSDNHASRPPQPGQHGQRRSGDFSRSPQKRIKPIRYRFLSPTEWSIFAQGVGALDPSDPECQAPIYPSSSSLFPARGMPNGLYKDIVKQRRKFFWYFHAVSLFRWLGMLLQLFIGAALTGIGSMSFTDGTPITIMAASNTIIAGILAMLHNSGLPDRYRYNQTEFEEVEDTLKRYLQTGVVEQGMTVQRVLMECFDDYRDARSIASRNDPAFYLRAHRGLMGRQQGGIGDFASPATQLPGGLPSMPPPTAPVPDAGAEKTEQPDSTKTSK